LVTAPKSVTLAGKAFSAHFIGPHFIESRFIGLWILMIDLIVFDKDGVILDIEATWLPVARAV